MLGSYSNENNYWSYIFYRIKSWSKRRKMEIQCLIDVKIMYSLSGALHWFLTTTGAQSDRQARVRTHTQLRRYLVSCS